MNDRVNDRLKSALQGEPEQEAVSERAEEDSEQEAMDAERSGVVTTDDELQGYFVVKAIVSQDISSARVAIRDTKSYCGVLLDDTNRKPICRLYFNGEQKYLGLFDENKDIERVTIDSPTISSNLRANYARQSNGTKRRLRNFSDSVLYCVVK